MAAVTRLLRPNLRNKNKKVFVFRSITSNLTREESEQENEFRVLNLRSVQQRDAKKRQYKKADVPPPRTHKMATDQDWSAVWPAPRSFHPASVPLPIRQGYAEKGSAPSKFANAELMKIPNFLHLTPPTVKQHCEALKKFCNPWPKGLETAEKWKNHFPIDIVTTDYCQASPTIRNPEARRVKLSIKLSDLKFDAHAKDKFLRLVGEHYNRDTDLVTIVTDRCPLRKQNYDYAMYLLTACYHESFTTESWEATKSEADMEYYHYDRNKSKESVEAIINWGRTPATANDKLKATNGFISSLEQLINEGENEYNLNKYKEEVIKMLNIGGKVK
ncbi:28S ribosomal protein S35, mitochondrial [Glossina fuscipes]|uniref:28S ribosomal protein S35, mitochondrial n=1 Tax=Glossina fuscipes TaxID=7396 RepID=A0A9C5ZQV4_9MUSC|nr:28S ribosomal protein S35, mitochondrial [Glossina fuscipes]